MTIKGIKGMTIAQIQDEVDNGGKFVTYSYCISFIAISFRKSSGIYFIRSHENSVIKGAPFTLVSLLFGWWGIPWGVIYTFASLYTNINGGKNITHAAMHYLHQTTNGHVFEFESNAALAF
jgi:hypothetical protein